MKKIMLLFAVVLGFAFTASAQDSEKAEFKFNEEKHDFGKIPQGIPVTPQPSLLILGKHPERLLNVVAALLRRFSALAES